jgi:amino acid transporter
MSEQTLFIQLTPSLEASCLFQYLRLIMVIYTFSRIALALERSGIVNGFCLSPESFSSLKALEYFPLAAVLKLLYLIMIHSQTRKEVF